jgi:cell division protein FtsL
MLFLITVSVGMAMVVLWESKEVVKAGYEITALEKKAGYLEEKNLELGTEISSLRSPQRILGKLADMGLELLPPEEGSLKKNPNTVSKSRMANGR